MLKEAERFRINKKLRDELPSELMAKAAILARNPDAFIYYDESLRGELGTPDLVDKEREVLSELADPNYPEHVNALREERTHRWRQSRGLYGTIILCSVGAAVQSVKTHFMPHYQIVVDTVLTTAQRVGPNRDKCGQSHLSRLTGYSNQPR